MALKERKEEFWKKKFNGIQMSHVYPLILYKYYRTIRSFSINKNVSQRIFLANDIIIYDNCSIPFISLPLPIIYFIQTFDDCSLRPHPHIFIQNPINKYCFIVCYLNHRQIPITIYPGTTWHSNAREQFVKLTEIDNGFPIHLVSVLSRWLTPYPYLWFVHLFSSGLYHVQNGGSPNIRTNTPIPQ